MTDPAPAWGLWWGSLEGADLPTLVASAAAHGFSTVSATPAMVFAATEASGASRPSRTEASGASRPGRTEASGALHGLLDDHGITVTMIDPLIRGLPGACAPDAVSRRWRSTFLHDEDDCHRAADAVGATIINVAHFLGAPVGHAALVDAIGAITERAAARGRVVAIEAMPEGGIADVTAAAAIARDVAHDACGVTVDTWHWWRSGGDLEELRALPPGVVRVVQLADAAADARGTGTSPPSRDRLVPGTGAMPVADIVALMAVAHPDALIGLEVFDRTAAGESPAARVAAVARAVGLGRSS